MSDTTANRPDGFPVRQEDDRIAAPSLVATGVVGIVVGAFAVFIAGVLLVVGVGALRASAAGPGGPRAARPEIANVEQTPVLDTRRGLDLRARQTRELETWGWIDRDAGIAKVPIDQAIDIVVSKGAQ
jgi:hypothetical protein